MKKAYKCLPAIIFVLFIGVMFVLFLVLPKKEYGTSEKDPLEPMPAFTLKSFFTSDKKNSFQTQFEDFITDHTAGRNGWVSLAAYYNYAIGNNASKGIYLCKDGYLINDPEERKNLDTNLGYIREFAENCPVDTTVLVAPSTGYVCDDVLPAVHKQYRDDEIFAEIGDTLGDTASFVDIREVFKSAYAAGNQMYYKTDHHWTAYGAYTAYRALGDTLGYTPLDSTAYTVTAYDGFYGTTYQNSGYWLNDPDSRHAGNKIWEYLRK